MRFRRGEEEGGPGGGWGELWGKGVVEGSNSNISFIS